MAKIIDQQEAKQGRWGTRVLTILAASVMLVLVAWAIAEVYGEIIQ
ncbi:hypothetical protein GCM10011491_11690 [Brucella endophytica]|uniref:Uncharacterized protein n=1 Tax=Brucella endophytica TaxID=1963359 RepID=A0A916S6H9_9HYPH|nr:hypothetical protein [Brucella endophytica]GGA85719.1 hypothetical protein GCM10011491_11690 [Brucella endophytica]